MNPSESCSICYKQVKTTEAVGSTICVKKQITVCSQICQQYLQYTFGFVHGVLVFQVLSRLCGNRFRGNPNAHNHFPSSFSGFLMVPENCNSRTNIHDDKPSETAVKREPRHLGRSDDDVSDLKVFFEKPGEGEQTVTDLQGKPADLTKTLNMKDLNEEDGMVDACPLRVQSSSEDENASFPAETDCGLNEDLHQAYQKNIDISCGAICTEMTILGQHKRNTHRKSTGKMKMEVFRCNKCSRKFKLQEDLQNHHCRISRMVNQDLFCDLCGQTFKDKVCLNEHMTSEHKQAGKVFQCNECHKKYTAKKALQRHVQFAHSKPSDRKCNICGCSFRSKILLKQHRLRKHQRKRDVGEKNTFACDQCHKECPSRKSLLHHVRFMHSKQIPSDCKVCKKTYRNMRLCREHMRTVHRVRIVSADGEETLLQCTYCPETFSATANECITNHLKQFHTKDMAPTLSCDLCGDKFKRKFTLDYHKRNTHALGLTDSEAKYRNQKEKMHPCDKCGKTLSKNSMRRHVLMFHSKHVPMDCQVCGKKLKSALHLERHMRCHRNQPNRVCHICGANLKTDQGLKSHLAAHKGVKSHICEICGAGFVRRTSWQRHVRQHSDTTFQCDICAKAFTTDYALHTHMLSRHQRGVYFNNRLKTVEELGFAIDKVAINRHLSHQCVVCGENLVCGKCPSHPASYMLTFICDRCGLKAKHIEFFCHHLKNHDNPVKFPATASHSAKNYTLSSATSKRGEAVMAYACKVCHKSFQRREYVSHHMKQHKEKTFSCPVCDKKFTYKCNMKNHLLTHSEDKPFQCEICQKGFKRQALLKCHARVHDPNRSPFKCHVCGKGLTRKQYLQQHYRLVHPEVQVIPAL